MSKTICIVVSDDMYNQLEELRTKHFVNVSMLIRNLIREYLNK